MGRTEGEEVSARCNRLRVGGREGDGSAEASVGPPHVSLPTRCGPERLMGLEGGEKIRDTVCRAVPCRAIKGSQGVSGGSPLCHPDANPWPFPAPVPPSLSKTHPRDESPPMSLD